MNHILMAQGVRYDLFLTDGNHWGITAGNDEAIPIVSQLGSIMQLRKCSSASAPSNRGNLNRLLVQIDAHASVADWNVPLASANDGVVVCVLRPSEFWGGSYVNLVRLSLILAHESQARGGVLIHGALAERDGIGVILAAPGGTGKTTASNRLPAPWRSLSDDTTLVVRTPQGNYWAHPWPTWSRFLDGDQSGTWDVQKAMLIKGIFFLVQASKDRIDSVDPVQAVGLLEESVGQTSAFMASGLSKEEIRALHLEQFNNLCTLARVIPTYMLHVSLTGTFWQEIEQTLGKAL